MSLKCFIYKKALQIAKFSIDYTVPDAAQKCVMVFAPHTSALDFVVGKMVLEIMGLNVKFLIRKESFRFPFNHFMRKLGGLPVDRQHATGLPVAIAQQIKAHKRITVVIAPEGTRKLNKRWKKGFYFIAQHAEVPICLCYIDWENRRGGIGPVMFASDNYEQDLQQIENFYRGMKGRHPENFNLS